MYAKERLIFNNNAHNAHLWFLNQAISHLEQDQPHQAASCIRRFVGLEQARRAERREIAQEAVKSPYSKQERALKAKLEALVRLRAIQEISW